MAFGGFSVWRAASVAVVLSLLSALFATPVFWRPFSSSSAKGEWKQETSGYMCKGRAGTHGYCGYHFHWGSAEDQPWCRTKHGCGQSGTKGSWMHCDAKGVERRRVEDGKFYTSKQFKDFYGSKGKDLWTAAARYAEKRMSRNGKPYSIFEFRDYYIDEYGEEGWVKEWDSASLEQRQAEDGKWYTWDEFAQYYGNQKAWSSWGSAQQTRTDL